MAAKNQKKKAVSLLSILALSWACSSSSTVIQSNDPGDDSGSAGAPAPNAGAAGDSSDRGGETSTGASDSAGESGESNGGSNSTAAAGEGGESPSSSEGGQAGEAPASSSGGAEEMGGDAGAGASETGGEASGAGGDSEGNTAGSGGQESSGGAGATGNQGGQNGSDCASDHSCVPRAAPGWSGPIVSAIAAEPPACPTEYPVLAFDAGTDLSAPDADCACECGALTGSCDDDSVTVTTYSTSDCSGDADSVVSDWETSSCVRFESATFDIAGPTSTSCGGPGSVDEMVAQANFANLVRGCEGATTDGSCADSGICLPEVESPFNDICVYREGEYECPTDYVVGSLVYQGFSDTRGCPGSCSCSPSGGACSLALTTYTGFSGGALCGDFWGSETIRSDDSDCVVVSSGAAARFGSPAFVEGSGQCSGSDPSPTGSATPTDAITMCCLD